MKKNQFSEMSAAELNEKVVELKKELFNLRFQLATGQLQDTTAIVNTKREIACQDRAARPRAEGSGVTLKGDTNMSEVRGMRKTRVGVVVSDKMDKTITIAVKYRVRHPLYGKIMNRTTKLKAHDEMNECGIGDTVRVMETRPLSRDKRWRLVEIIEKAK